MPQIETSPTSSKILLCLCLSFIGGIFLASFFPVCRVLLLGILVLGILFASVFWSRRMLLISGLCILLLALGILRYQIFETSAENNKLAKSNNKNQTIALTGLVVKEPDLREKNVRLTIEVETLKGNPIKPLKGRVLVVTGKYQKYRYGDRLWIKGKLKSPPVFKDFNYRDYLKKQRIYSLMYYPKIQLISRNRGSPVYAGILSVKKKLRNSIYQHLPPPRSSLLAALILGDKGQISKEWKEKLNLSGLRHITAISGMHIAILTSILMTLLIGLGLWRSQAFYLTIILITLFVVMSGLQPSAVRAGIMGGLFLLAQHLGRLSASFRSLVLAGTLMLIQNPLLLKSDVGFQLSFLAMMGIIYLSPLFQNWLKFIPNALQLKSVLSMTLSAQIFTLPILIYNFGYVSPLSVFSNVLIVPLLPCIMGAGFVYAFAGAVWQNLGWLFSGLPWLLLTYVVEVVKFFSGFPPLVLNLPWQGLLIYYLILALFIWKLLKNQKTRFVKV